MLQYSPLHFPDRHPYSLKEYQRRSQWGMKRAFHDAFPVSTPSTSTKIIKSKLVKVLFVCDEWNSNKGGLSTFNREFAINLARSSRDDFAVHCYVCQSSESYREGANKNGVSLLTAKIVPGTYDRLEWLRLPPSELPRLMLWSAMDESLAPRRIALYKIQTASGCSLYMYFAKTLESTNKRKQMQ